MHSSVHLGAGKQEQGESKEPEVCKAAVAKADAKCAITNAN